MTDHLKQPCECVFSNTQVTSFSKCDPIPCDGIRTTDVVSHHGGKDDRFELVDGFVLTQMFDFEKCLSIRCATDPCGCEKKDDDQKWYIEKILPVQVVIAEFDKNKHDKCS